MYEWDEIKRLSNLSKHGLSFEDAESAFTAPCVTFRDHRFDYREQRYITLGSLQGRIIVIAHTPRGDKTRIISMRKANHREQKAYAQRLEEDR